MEWEQCKENVKPKREGRTVSNIATPKKDNAAIAEIQERQAEFEKEIENYEGDDELDVWDRYVRFMDNAYPEGDGQSEVSAIQLRLARKFMNEERYKNDVRLLNAFIDFATQEPDATQVYGFCYKNKIGLKVPRFWNNFASAFIYKRMYKKAMSCVTKARKIFGPEYKPFKVLELEIAKLMHEEEESAPVVENLRSVGSTLKCRTEPRQDVRQSAPRQPLGNQSEGAKFRVLSDNEAYTAPVPSNSCNPMDRKRTDKENTRSKPQRWKNCAVATESVRHEPGASKFTVFEETAATNDAMTPRHNTTALTTKKVPQQEKCPGSFEQTLLNNKTQRNECVAYSKSKVYPRVGGEWSFEELWAKYRFLKSQENSVSDLSTVEETEEIENEVLCSRKRSSSTEGEGDVFAPEKKPCTKNLAESSQSAKLPLKSCITPHAANTLSSTNFAVDFAPENTISSSTRKVVVEEHHLDNFDVFTDEPEPSVMKPNKSLLSDKRSKLKLSTQLSSSDNPVIDAGVPQNMTGSVNTNEDFFDIAPDDEDEKDRFTLDKFESTMNAKNFSIFEDPTQMREKVFKLSKKQLLVESLEETNEEMNSNKDYKQRGLSIASSTKLQVQDHDIFEDIESPARTAAEKTKTGFGMSSDIRQSNKRRSSIAFDIFSDDPEPVTSLQPESVNESNEYHLKTIMKTPYNEKASIGDVPWTWGKVKQPNDNLDVTEGIKEYTKSNTMKINEQVHDGLFGDAESDSSIIEGIVPVNPKPCLRKDKSERQSKGRVCFGDIPSPANDINDHNNSRASTGSETAMVPVIQSITKAFGGQFEESTYQDNYFQDIQESPTRLSTSQQDLEHESIDIQYRTLPSDIIANEGRKQLTPILEGSMDSRLSSNASSKSSLSGLCQGQTIAEEDSLNITKDVSIIKDAVEVQNITSSHVTKDTSSTTMNVKNFSIFEDPTQMGDDAFKTAAAKLRLSSKKQFLVESLEETPEEFDCNQDYKQPGLSISSKLQVQDQRIVKDIDNSTENTGLSCESGEHTTDIHPARGRRSEEKTSHVIMKAPAPLNQTRALLPDKTQRDVCCDPEFLPKAPRHSLAPKEAISNPYDQTLMNDLMQSLDPPLFYRTGFHQYDEDLKLKSPLLLGKVKISGIKCIGEGAFAKVYKGVCTSDDKRAEHEQALKVQSPAAPWEFYILSEVLERLTNTNVTAQIIDMILPGRSMHVYNNMSVLVTPCFMEGSLLDMVNIYRKASPAHVPEVVILTYTLDMLRCVQALHRIGIIHGDIKPDNWLLRDKENTMTSMSMLYTKSVVLIDFGRSIDMKLMPPGSEFTTSCNTDLFECVEMQTNRPWTYQVDYYGILACIYLLFHNEYMKVKYDNTARKWMPDKKPPRRMNRELVDELFSDLLNIKDCQSIPPLEGYINKLQNYMQSINGAERRKQLRSHYSFVSSMQL